MELRWKRDGVGRQVSLCGRYAVQSDGYGVRNPFGGTEDYGVRGGEWAAILVESNENLNWFDTMKEAKAECQRHANKSDEDTKRRQDYVWRRFSHRRP